MLNILHPCKNSAVPQMCTVGTISYSPFMPGVSTVCRWGAAELLRFFYTQRSIIMKFLSVLKSAILLFILLSLVSCVGKQTAQTEQAPAPTVAKLEKNYDNLYFLPFTAKPEVSKDYPQAANELQRSMVTTLQRGKSFKKVSTGTSKQSSDAKTLVVKANIIEMRIVSGSARMWGGAFAGSSGIEFDLQLIDGASGKVVRKEHMSSWNNAFAASWSGGSSDNSLLDDMGKITAQYIIDSMPAK